MSRIRYEHTRKHGVLQSVKSYQHPNSGARYKVQLDTVEGQWLVLDATTELVAASGRQLDGHKMRIEVRDALTKLGISLVVESRKKKLQQVA